MIIHLIELVGFRYLNDLDYQGNAGWECIQKQTLWIKSMLLDCQVEHQGKGVVVFYLFTHNKFYVKLLKCLVPTILSWALQGH